jgi:hypothetical protein
MQMHVIFTAEYAKQTASVVMFLLVLYNNNKCVVLTIQAESTRYNKKSAVEMKTPKLMRTTRILISSEIVPMV